VIAKKKRVRRTFLPIPDWLEIGALVRYFRRGQHVGHVKQIAGNKVAIMPIGYNSDGQKRGKWFSISEVQKVD